MGLCASKNQSNYVQPASKVSLLSRHTLGSKTTVGVELASVWERLDDAKAMARICRSSFDMERLL
jgi:hypothetical protein